MASAAVFRRCLQLIVLAAAAACSLADINFVNHTCQYAYSPDICFSMLMSDRRSINASTLAEIAYIALDIDATVNIPSTVGVLKPIRDKNRGTNLEGALNQCIMLYNTAGSELAHARDAVSSKNYNYADSLITAASADHNSCQKMFVDVEKPAVVAEKVGWLELRIDVCADLVMSLII